MSRVGAARALWNRSVWGWNRTFGWPALVGVSLLAASGLLYALWTPQLEHERIALVQRQATRSAAAALAQSQGPANAQEGARIFVESLPSSRQRSRDIGALLDAAKASNLVIERADYVVQQEPNVPITRLKAIIPVKGSYADVRQLITRVLNGMPHAMLEDMQLERTSATATQLDAVLQFALLYRTDQP
ncbi:MAG: hypothetical protein KGQ77_00405 [Betaproteobacteria bacterium]|nr:hypothetical protein [Betaproteobacteria bacterium]